MMTSLPVSAERFGKESLNICKMAIVEFFFGNLYPGVFDFSPFGLPKILLCDIELGGFVFRGQKSVVANPHKT